MIIGYARSWTGEQNIDVQIAALEKAGCEKIYANQGLGGIDHQNRKYQRCISSLHEGDTLVVWKLDRLSHDLSSILTTLDVLNARGVFFKSLIERVDTKEMNGAAMWQMLSAMADFGRSIISERTRAGVKAAQERGVKFGRKDKLTPEQIETARTMIENGQRVDDVAKLFDVNRATIYRKVKPSKPTERTFGQQPDNQSPEKIWRPIEEYYNSPELQQAFPTVEIKRADRNPTFAVYENGAFYSPGLQKKITFEPTKFCLLPTVRH